MLRNLNHVQCSNKGPMEKALWSRWNMSSWFTAPLEKAWFYERLFFEEVIVKIKIYALYEVHKSNLPVAFEEFEVVYIFFATFFLLLSLSVYKRSTLAKILGGRGGGGLQLPQFPGFYGPGLACRFKNQ